MTLKDKIHEPLLTVLSPTASATAAIRRRAPAESRARPSAARAIAQPFQEGTASAALYAGRACRREDWRAIRRSVLRVSCSSSKGHVESNHHICEEFAVDRR